MGAQHETAPDGVDAHPDRMFAWAHRQSGGCPMGPDPATAVIAPDLAVHGIRGLWVADSSIFPDMILHIKNLAC